MRAVLRVLCALCGICVLTIAVTCKPQSGKRGLTKIHLSESVLRQIALVTVTPPFPQKAREKGITGIAVVEVTTSEAGIVSFAKVLQSPDPVLNGSLEAAAKQWRFKPQTVSGTPVSLVGTLTFYYVMENGKGVVRNPDEMPIVR